MGAQLRVFRQQIKSVQATKKITRAMELIASSRIVKAQAAVRATEPYATALQRALTLTASHTESSHPLLSPAAEPKRAAVLIVTADRGLAGAYSANAIKAGEQLTENLNERGLEVVPFIIGRKGVGFYKFRERNIEDSWTGCTDKPTFEDAKGIADTLVSYFLKDSSEGGVDEIHLVYTKFINMITQEPRVIRLVPLEVVEEVVDTSESHITGGEDEGGTAIWALYDFEPDAKTTLDLLLPKYIEHLVYVGLLESAASEHAARQRSMKSATDNAEDLIKKYTRQANQARQAEITQELSEIVGGAAALSG